MAARPTTRRAATAAATATGTRRPRRVRRCATSRRPAAGSRSSGTSGRSTTSCSASPRTHDSTDDLPEDGPDVADEARAAMLAGSSRTGRGRGRSARRWRSTSPRSPSSDPELPDRRRVPRRPRDQRRPPTSSDDPSRPRARPGDSATSSQRASTGDQAALAALREAMPEHKAGFQPLLARPGGGHRRLVRDPSRLGDRVRGHRAADRGDPRARLRPARRRTAARYAGRPHRADDRRHPLAARGRHPAGHPRAVLLQPAVQLPAGRRRLAVLRLSGRRRRPRGRRPLAPPPAVVRLHRALGDETRLRILKLLAGRDLYLTEIAQQLDLSKPTIKHHLALLRAAGLVTIIEAGTSSTTASAATGSTPPRPSSPASSSPDPTQARSPARCRRPRVRYPSNTGGRNGPHA